MIFWCVLVFIIGSVCSAPTIDTNKTYIISRYPREVNKNHCNCACGVIKKSRVIGGVETEPHEFPWLSGINIDGEFRCGGSLITRKHILTAAHCVYGYDITKMRISLGLHDRNVASRDNTVKRVVKVRPHEGFEPRTFNNDIAILELDQPVDFSSEIRPACLPQNADTDYSDNIAVIAGWGKTTEKGNLSPTPLKLEVPVWPRKKCLDESGYQTNRITENMFCAGYSDGEKDACQGDSGGPLHFANKNGKMEIIGLVSWGRGCARPKLPGLYTKVTNYLDWISETVNASGECLCPSSKKLVR